MDRHPIFSRLSARKIEKADLSKYGVEDAGDLFIRKLSAADRSVIIDLWKAEQSTEASGYVLAAALVDAEGRKIFDDPAADSKAIINEWPCDLVDGLATQVMKFTGLMKDEEQPEKN